MREDSCTYIAHRNVNILMRVIIINEKETKECLCSYKHMSVENAASVLS